MPTDRDGEAGVLRVVDHAVVPDGFGLAASVRVHNRYRSDAAPGSRAGGGPSSQP